MTSTKMLVLADALDFIVKGSLYFQSGCQMFPDVTLSVFIVHAVKTYFILNHQNNSKTNFIGQSASDTLTNS